MRASMPAKASVPSVGLRFVLRGEKGPGTGWLARAQWLLEGEEHECVERGYLLLPVVLRLIDEADLQGAFAVASEAAEIGERFGETDLTEAARHMQGRALLRQGQVEKGLAFLDEVMIAATAGELSSFVTGFVYCSVIDGCQEIYELGRAREWTAALADWCAEQSELVFTGKCLVHRSQIMQMNGAWTDAIEEARRASQRLLRSPTSGPTPRRYTSKPRCIVCAGNLTRPRRRTKARASWEGNRSRGSRSCG